MIRSRLTLSSLLMSLPVFMICVCLQSAAQAQLFGNRTIGSAAGAQLQSPTGLGSPGARGRTPSLGAAGQSAATGTGLLDGSERFLRGNRSRADFVGTGRNDLTGFVGAGQAIGVGRVPAATESFRLEAMNAARVNKPLPKQPTKGLYYPRLVVDFDPTDEPNREISAVASSPEIQRRVKNAGGSGVQVLIAGNTAILKGTVDSKRISDRVANILSFEPGIDRIDNQLRVP